MFVTVYTDASFCETGRAGGAAWIRSDKGTLKYTRPFKASNNNEAEALIAWFAINHAIYHWPETSSILVKTDSMTLCQAWKTPNPKTKIGRIAHALLKLSGEHGIVINFRHVKGHTGGKDIRSWLNSWCDKFAKETLRGNNGDKKPSRKTKDMDTRLT